MKIRDLLDRIAERQRALGISETEVSRAAVSMDTIRNWRRAAADGRDISPRHDSLARIADRLGVSLAWLLGDDPVAAPRQAVQTRPGFSDTAAPYRIEPAPPRDGDSAQTATLRAIYGTKAGQPSSLRVLVALPAFALAPGDVLIIDLARLPRSGELAVVTVFDDEAAASATLIMQIAEPWLIHGGSPDGQMLRIDDPAVTVRHPVIGSIRGLPVET